MHEGILLACQVGNRGQYQDVHTEDSNAVWEIVKFVGHDGAREFATTSLKFFYDDEGIEITVPYAHQTSRQLSGRYKRLLPLDAACYTTQNWTNFYVARLLCSMQESAPSPEITNNIPFKVVDRSKPSIKHM